MALPKIDEHPRELGEAQDQQNIREDDEEVILRGASCAIYDGAYGSETRARNNGKARRKGTCVVTSLSVCSHYHCPLFLLLGTYGSMCVVYSILSAGHADHRTYGKHEVDSIKKPLVAINYVLGSVRVLSSSVGNDVGHVTCGVPRVCRAWYCRDFFFPVAWPVWMGTVYKHRFATNVTKFSAAALAG